MAASAFETLCSPGTFRATSMTFSPWYMAEKFAHAFFVKGDISRIKIAGITHTVGNDLWSESLYDLLIVLDFAVDDNGTIFFCIFCK